MNTLHENTCQCCGKVFTTKRTGAKTCSNACRQRRKHYRALNTKEAKQAMRTFYVLRCAAVMGTDVQAVYWLSQIRSALGDEIGALRKHGIELPQGLAIAIPHEEDCTKDVAALRGLRQKA